MWGARAILKELPLFAMTMEMVRFKRAQRKKLQEQLTQSFDSYLPRNESMEADVDSVSTALLTQLSGQTVDYGQQGADLHAHGAETTRELTERDIETYELVSDLFWWYCKMDIYQSILGGTPLM